MPQCSAIEDQMHAVYADNQYGSRQNKIILRKSYRC